MADELVEKTPYLDEALAEWVESVAENSDRSESYVMRELLQVVAEHAGEPPESVDLFAAELKDDLGIE